MKRCLPTAVSSVCLLGALFTPVPCSAQAPSIKSGGIVGASAFGQFTSIAPGSWIEIYGSNLAVDSRSWSGSDFNGVNAPTSLDGTKVTIGGQLTFIDYISPGQVNAQVPSNVATGSQQVTVTTASGTSAPFTITVSPTQPGLLAPSSFNVGGTQYATALFSDGATFVLPPGAIASVPSRRAQPGDTITLYGIGFGSVIPNIPAGQVVQQSNTLASTLQVKFGTALGTVTYDGLAPSAVGLYQFNVIVPSIPSSDSVPLTFTLGSTAGTQTLYLAVQNGNATTQVKSLTLSASTVAGGGTVQGTVTLSAAAPTGGAVVALSSNSSAASVPATVMIAAGSTSTTFTLSAGAVSSNQTAIVTASYGGASAQATLIVTASTVFPFNGINVTATFSTGTETSNMGVIDIDTSVPAFFGPASVVAIFSGSSPITGINATFSAFNLVGQTLTISQPLPYPQGGYVAINNSLEWITAGSVTLNLSSPDSFGNGTTTGTFTLTTSSRTVTGTISGPYNLGHGGR